MISRVGGVTAHHHLSATDLRELREISAPRSVREGSIPRSLREGSIPRSLREGSAGSSEADAGVGEGGVVSGELTKAASNGGSLGNR